MSCLSCLTCLCDGKMEREDCCIVALSSLLVYWLSCSAIVVGQVVFVASSDLPM